MSYAVAAASIIKQSSWLRWRPTNWIADCSDGLLHLDRVVTTARIAKRETRSTEVCNETRLTVGYPSPISADEVSSEDFPPQRYSFVFDVARTRISQKFRAGQWSKSLLFASEKAQHVESNLVDDLGASDRQSLLRGK
jgi:hypothetical protein